MTLTAPIVTSLNADERSVLKDIVDEVSRNYSCVSRMLLFGSKARGDFAESSDIDLLVVLGNSVSFAEKQDVADMIYTHEVGNDVVISTVFVTERDYYEKVNVFLSVVRREGIELWSRG